MSNNLSLFVSTARKNYSDTNVITYVFNPFTGAISSNIDKFCKLGTHLCLYSSCFPIYDNENNYKGYFIGDKVNSVVNGEIIKTESVNSYFGRKFRQNTFKKN